MRGTWISDARGRTRAGRCACTLGRRRFTCGARSARAGASSPPAAGSWGGSRAAVPIFLGGLALLLIGYIGLFFARLIKAAVSRQREFLADASSVQFTRTRDGIAGALDQIEIASAGALIANRHAESLSHMFFGQGIQVRLHGLFDTHPPLEARIARVHERFDRSNYRKTRGSAVADVDGVSDLPKKSISQRDAA